jgi:type IX secretion system PorP/SprF family membrane protein
MKRLLKLLACGIILCAGEIQAQQDPMYSQYMFNMLSINPAYTGSRDMLSFTALYRKQWAGIEGAPTTFTFTADTPIRNQKMALGINLVNDKIGIAKNTVLNLSYAYRIRFVNEGILSFGLQAGADQYSADYSSVNTSQKGGVYDQAFAGSASAIFPNFGFGVYYHTQRFYIGLASPKMIKNKLRGENAPTLDFTSYPNRQNRHLFMNVGYDFELNQEITLKPSLMIKQVVGAPLAIDVNVNAYWKKLVGAGISYRTGDAILVMLEFQAQPELHIGYAYDMTLSKLSGTNAGSHEVLLRYDPFAKKHLKASRSRMNYNKKPVNKKNKKSYRPGGNRKNIKRSKRRIG